MALYEFDFMLCYVMLRRGVFSCRVAGKILCDHIWQATHGTSEMDFH